MGARGRGARRRPPAEQDGAVPERREAVPQPQLHVRLAVPGDLDRHAGPGGEDLRARPEAAWRVRGAVQHRFRVRRAEGGGRWFLEEEQRIIASRGR